MGHSVGTIDVTEDVYADDDALLEVLAFAGHIDRSEMLEVVEEEFEQIDIFDYETNALRLSLVLIH